MKQSRKIMLVVSLTSALAFGTVAAFASNGGANLFANENVTWMHYAEKAPTKTTGGIKEYWVSCETNEHVFVAPTGGTIQEGTNVLASVPSSDDRYLKSYDEVDALIGGDGYLPYQKAGIDAAKAAYNDYPASDKAAYDAASGKVATAETNYGNSFTLGLNTGLGCWTVLGNSLPDSGLYSNWSLGNVNSDHGPALSLKVKTASAATGYRTSSFTKADTSSTGMMYIKAPYATSFNIEDAWQNNKVTYSLVAGWNEITFTAAQWAGFKQTGGVRYYASAALEANDTPWLLTDMWGVTASGDVARRVAGLGSTIEAYESATISDAYNALSAEDKAKVTNYADKAEALAKNYCYAGASIYGSTDGKGTFTRVTGTLVGKAYQITTTQEYTNYNFRVNLMDAQAGVINTEAHVSSDKAVIYTYGLAFTDGEDQAFTLKDHGGSNYVVGRMTHTNLANGWVRHSITDSRMRSLSTYVDGKSDSQNYLRFYFATVPTGTFYVSSVYGIHA